MTEPAAGHEEWPDYEGPEGARLRAEASALGARRSALFDEATAKRNAGDVAAANALVREAQEAGREMEARNAAAAEAIARYNNEAKGKGDDFLDLHGLREAEAVALLRQRLARLRAKPAGTVTALELIPGAGHHSAPGKQKLMAAAQAVLKEEQLSYKELTVGSMMVEVVGTGEAAKAAPVEEAKKPEAAEERVKPAAEAAPKKDVKKPEAAADAVKPAAEAGPKERTKKSEADASKEKKKKEKKSKICKCCSIM
ncbi:uncharacterized protein TM35_000441560 [Trypanosoma theileri]|uniref:Smr domain-containing protein n=1 Tax=Trypanosoma theileri TaxID=67003 RepID=A0A1X0NK68_9TRYP|nr:uncharacterized protein TM35_000441560 [Trypanosoma theileri]ORC84500.1 hypothetical protein TM35_000441560 [Trypanosoma theileri]